MCRRRPDAARTDPIHTIAETDEAAEDPCADEVRALLDGVPRDSADAAAAAELRGRIEGERKAHVEELDAFEMGSTVILLFEPGRAALLDPVKEGARVRVGEPLGGPR